MNPSLHTLNLKNTSINKNKINTVLLLVIVFLSSCSDSNIPSERDIKKNISNQFEGCEYVEVMNVKKLDGMPQQNGSYLVKATFDIKLNPIKENIKAWEVYSENLKKYEALDKVRREEIDDARNRHDQLFDKLQKEYSQINEENYDKLTIEQDKIKSKVNDLRKDILLEEQANNIRFKAALKNADIASFNPKSSNTFYEQYRKLNAECKYTNGLGKSLIDKIIFNDSTKGSEILGIGTTTSFSYEFQMIKTENGWKLEF